MAEFINTIDALGDEAVMDSIIDRSITEFKDDILTEIGGYAFDSCTNLADVDLPNVTVINYSAFANASITSSLNLPKLTRLNGYTFQHAVLPEIVCLPSFTNGSSWDLSFTSGMKHLDLPIATNVPNRFCLNCGSLETVNLPKVETISQLAFGDYYGPGGNKLRRVDLPVCTSIQAEAFTKATLLIAMILRASTLCSLGNTNVFNNTPIASGTGYIYVPRALVDSYKAATNWSTYAEQFRALEDYTVDGTITGKMAEGTVSYNIQGIFSSNTEPFAVGSYQTTLTVLGDNPVVSVTMDGVDITTDVYNSETHEISIPLVTGDIEITAKSDSPYIVVSTPLNGDESGDLPRYKLNVTAGQKLRIHYYLTKSSGYLYDGRGCGTNYDNSGHTINANATQDVTIVSDGYIVFSDYYSRDIANGELGLYAADRLTGKYLYVEILE